MDRISIAGLLLGLVAILGGQVLEGGSIGSLVQPTAFLIVLGGTMGAVMLQSPLPVFLNGMRMAKWVLVPPVTDPERLIKQIEQWSNIARKEGLLALENQIAALKEPFRANTSRRRGWRRRDPRPPRCRPRRPSARRRRRAGPLARYS